MIPDAGGNGSLADGEPSLLRNTALASSMFIGRAVLAFVTTTLVARGLGVIGRGRIVYVTNLAGLLALVASAGTIAVINRLHSVEGPQRGDASRLGAPAAVVGVILGVVGAAAYWLVATAQGSIESVGIGTSLLVVVATVALVVTANLTQVASLADRIAAVTWTALVGVAAYCLVTVITVATDTATVANNVAAWAVCSIIPVLLLIWPARAVRMRIDEPTAGRPRTSSLRAASRRLLRLSLRANVAGTAVIIIWRLDVVIVQARRGDRELGLYSIAVALAEIVLVLAMAVRSALLPHHHLESAELGSIVARITRIAVAGTAVMAIVVAGVGRPVLTVVFGAEYAGAYPALLLLLPGTVFLVLHYPIFDFIAARGGTAGLRSLTIMGITAVVVNAIGNLVLLGSFSYTAAAAVSTVTYGFVFVWCCVRFHHLAGVGYRDLFVLRRSDLHPEVTSSP